MSMIAMATPSSHFTFKNGWAWGDESMVQPAEFPARPQTQTWTTEPERRIALPSIRQAIPELSRPLAPGSPNNTAGSGAMTPPEYVHSPTNKNSNSSIANTIKRRRLSIDDEAEAERARQVPRRYGTPPRGPPRPSPPLPSAPVSASGESWPAPPTAQAPPALAPTRSSPHFVHDTLPAMRSPRPAETDQRQQQQPQRVAAPEPRVVLPGLPFLNLDGGNPAPPSGTPAGPPPPNYRSMSMSGDEYASEQQQQPQGMGPRGIDPPKSRPYSYAGPTYHHAPRSQSLSMGGGGGGAAHPFDRTRFSAAPGQYPPPPPPTGSSATAVAVVPRHPASHFPEYLHMGDMGMGLGYGMQPLGLGVGPDCTKQRKRRGNLPKETTDKLRSWFMAHLHHPYPSDEEKQEFMRRTGLQMNQISNWFINARRRALPQMLNDKRMAEASAAAQNLAGTPTGVLSPNERDSGPPPTAAPFDDRLHCQSSSLKRGSV